MVDDAGDADGSSDTSDPLESVVKTLRAVRRGAVAGYASAWLFATDGLPFDAARTVPANAEASFLLCRAPLRCRACCSNEELNTLQMPHLYTGMMLWCCFWGCFGEQVVYRAIFRLGSTKCRAVGPPPFVRRARRYVSQKCLLYSRALHRFCMGQPNLKKYPCRAQRRSLRTGSSRALGGVLLGAGATVRRAPFPTTQSHEPPCQNRVRLPVRCPPDVTAR